MKIQILNSENGQFYWRIVARNGRTLATGETYVSKQGAIKGAECLIDGLSNIYTGFRLNLQDLT